MKAPRIGDRVWFYRNTPLVGTLTTTRTVRGATTATVRLEDGSLTTLDFDSLFALDEGDYAHWTAVSEASRRKEISVPQQIDVLDRAAIERLDFRAAVTARAMIRLVEVEFGIQKVATPDEVNLAASLLDERIAFLRGGYLKSRLEDAIARRDELHKIDERRRATEAEIARLQNELGGDGKEQ